MIRMGAFGIAGGEDRLVDAMNDAPASSRLTASAHVAESVAPMQDRTERLDELASHLDFLWRFACRMGVPAGVAEDIAQDAFVVAASRLDDILPTKERSFLVSVVVHKVRRERVRASRHEELVDEPPARSMAPDEQLDDERARRLLDMALDTLDDDLRMVFVLHEIEEETMADIAQMLDLAPGTVASRLRRAREEWRKATNRMKRSLPARRSS